MPKLRGRSIRHVTPRYVLDRLRQAWYFRRNPRHPWLTASAIEFLTGWLRTGDRGFEWGSGRSTLWFADRIGSLVSVEDSEEWYARVSADLRARGIESVDYRRIDKKSPAPGGSGWAYVAVADEFEAASFDFVLVDGKHRDECCLAALRLLRPGGLLVLDNGNLYIPSDSRSPRSRSRNDGPASPAWSEFLRAVETWRLIWTTDGVSDTLLWFGPCAEKR